MDGAVGLFYHARVGCNDVVPDLGLHGTGNAVGEGRNLLASNRGGDFPSDADAQAFRGRRSGDGVDNLQKKATIEPIVLASLAGTLAAPLLSTEALTSVAVLTYPLASIAILVGTAALTLAIAALSPLDVPLTFPRALVAVAVATSLAFFPWTVVVVVVSLELFPLGFSKDDGSHVVSKGCGKEREEFRQVKGNA